MKSNSRGKKRMADGGHTPSGRMSVYEIERIAKSKPNLEGTKIKRMKPPAENESGRMAEREQTKIMKEKPKMAKGGGWMQETKNPETKGALRKSLHVKKGHNIPEAKLQKAEHSKNPLTKKRAVLAETYKKSRPK
jgi:hypothetical protein